MSDVSLSARVAIMMAAATLCAGAAFGQGRIAARNADVLTLSVGSRDGVKAGMRGDVVKTVGAGAAAQPSVIASFVVTKVGEQASEARLEKIEAGFEGEPMVGLRVAFDEPLRKPEAESPPAQATPRPTPASGLPDDPVELLSQGVEAPLCRQGGRQIADALRQRARDLKGLGEGPAVADLLKQVGGPHGGAQPVLGPAGGVQRACGLDQVGTFGAAVAGGPGRQHRGLQVVEGRQGLPESDQRAPGHALGVRPDHVVLGIRQLGRFPGQRECAPVGDLGPACSNPGPPLNEGGWWLIAGFFLTASLLLWWARMYRRARALGQ
jgi:hypothetical protein